jgi:hypothetical protein
MGYLDPWLEQFRESTGLVELAAPEEIVEEFADDPIVEAAGVSDGDDPASIESTEAAADRTSIDATPVPETAAPQPELAEEEPAAQAAMQETEVAAEEVASELQPEPEPVVQQPRLVDFSTLPPPNAIVNFSMEAPAAASTNVALREDGDPVVIDFIRGDDASEALTLRLVEVDYSGTRSPWSSGQYALSNAGLVVFPAGQPRARITLRTASDPRREADQRSTLRLQPNSGTDAELAVLNVTIEDDDRRAFEDKLPANTVGFGTSQVSVSEADSAVQVDVMRFNPDNSTMDVEFTVEALSATEGEDYFPPGINSISFGPGQRVARILIPLVQDSRGEGDEAFVVKLLVNTETQPIDVSPNIAVMIRDDER